MRPPRRSGRLQGPKRADGASRNAHRTWLVVAAARSQVRRLASAENGLGFRRVEPDTGNPRQKQSQRPPVRQRPASSAARTRQPAKPRPRNATFSAASTARGPPPRAHAPARRLQSQRRHARGGESNQACVNQNPREKAAARSANPPAGSVTARTVRTLAVGRRASCDTRSLAEMPCGQNLPA